MYYDIATKGEKRSLWELLDIDTQAQLLISKQGKRLYNEYSNYIHRYNSDKLAKKIVEKLPLNATAKECENVAFCMCLLLHAKTEILQSIYEWLKNNNDTEQAEKIIRGNTSLAKKLNII